MVTSTLNSELTVRDEVDVISPCTEPAPGQRGIACQRPRHWCCPVAACLLTDRLEACERTMPEQWQIPHHQHLPVYSTAPWLTENRTVIHPMVQSNYQLCLVFYILTLSPPIPLRLYALPYWSNPPFNFWHLSALTFRTERQSARMSKIKNGGLDQYGAEPFEQQQFGTADVEGVEAQFRHMVTFQMFGVIEA